MSNNEIASGNFSKNTLINFNADFNGLEKTIGLFFPSIRHAMVERYRAETTLKIGLKAQEITQELVIETRPIPPKAALPLFDKLSLEHEEEMYKVWAELLVAASDEYKPIQIQYAEILSKIGYKEATELLKIYNFQRKIKFEGRIGEKRLWNTFKQLIPPTDYIEVAMNILNKEMQVRIETLPEDKKSIMNEIEKLDFSDKSTQKIEESVSFSFYIFDKNVQETFELLRLLQLIETYRIKASTKQVAILTDFGYKMMEMLEKYRISQEAAI